MESREGNRSKTKTEKQDGSFNDIIYSSNLASGSQIAQLQDECDKYQRKIDLERKKLEKIDKQINEVQEKIKEQRQGFKKDKTQGDTNEKLKEQNQDIQKNKTQEDINGRILEQKLAIQMNKTQEEANEKLKELKLAIQKTKTQEETNENIKDKKKGFQKIKAQQDTKNHLIQNIKQLQNRLEKSLQKFNETVAHNKYLREKIDQLRRDKITNDAILKNLTQDLEEWQRRNEKFKKESEQIDQEIRIVENEIQNVKLEAHKEQEEKEDQLQELNALVDQDKKWKEIIQIQDQEQQKLAIKDLHQEALELKKKVKHSSGWGIARDKASIHDSIEKVQIYEEAFAKIQNATGISDIDELVKTFIEAEKRNFSIYNYVNELSNEMEALDSQIAKVKSQIEKSQQVSNTSDSKKKKLIEEIDQKLIKADQRIMQNEEKYQQTMRTLNGLKVGIQSIFDRIGCNTETVQEMLGFSQVTEANLMQYLGIIEQRTNEILQLYSACQAQSIDNNALYQNQQVQNMGKEEKFKIEVPNMNEEQEVEQNEEDLPLTKEGFIKKAQEKFDKKSEKGGSSKFAPFGKKKL